MKIERQRLPRLVHRPDPGIIELNRTELGKIAGGINPQPLPPRHDD